MDETIRSTADSQLNKQAKLELAETASYVDDLRKTQDAQRESVRRYEELKVFGGEVVPAATPHNGDDVGRIIICDDYRVDNSTTAPNVPTTSTSKLTLAGWIAAAALAGYALMLANTPTQEPETPTATSVDDRDTRYSLEFTE